MILPYKDLSYLVIHFWPLWPHQHINIGSYWEWHLNTRSWTLSLSKSESPASHPSVTCLFQCGAIESPASRRKMRVLREAVLARNDWPLLYDKLAISNTYSHAKNRNDPRPITLSKMAFLESGFSAVAILGGGWLQSPASDGPPWIGWCSKPQCSSEN